MSDGHRTLSSPALHVLRSARAEQLRDDLARSRHDVVDARRVLVEIGREFYAALRQCCDAGQHTPVFVLRGGLLMRDAFGLSGGTAPIGLIVPHRDEHQHDPVIAYCSVPEATRGLTVTDVLMASGRTAFACLRELHVRRADGTMLGVAAPFLADAARNLLLTNFPQVTIHAFWPDERVDAAGRMVGPGFDVGDYSLGGPSNGYQSWRGGVR